MMMTSKSVVAAVTLLATITTFAVAAVAPVPPETYLLQYNVGNTTGGWRNKGMLLVTEHAVKLEEPATAWTYEDVVALRQGSTYKVRVVSADDRQEVFAMARFSPCTLLTAKLYANTPLKSTMERIAIFFTPSKSSQHGRRPSGLKQLSPFVDTVCELGVFAPAVKAAQAAAGKHEPEASSPSNVAMKFTVQAGPHLPAPADPPALVTPPSSAPLNPGEKKKPQVGPDGKPLPPQDDRSFFEKYWMYIVMFLGYSVVSNFLAPKPKPGAAPAGAAAAAN
jgi:hypothetical protein